LKKLFLSSNWSSYMLENRHNSEDHDLNSWSRDNISWVEGYVDESSDVSLAGEPGDLPPGSDLFPRVLVSAAHDDVSQNILSGEKVRTFGEIKVDTLTREILQESGYIPKIHSSCSEASDSPSQNGTVAESLSYTSHPISQALLSDREDLCKMRLLTGKPPDDEQSLLSIDMAGVRLNDEPLRDDEMGTMSRTKAQHVRRKSRKSIDLGCSDELKSVDDFESSTQQTQRKSILVEETRMRSSSLPNTDAFRRNTYRMVGNLPAKSITWPLKKDWSSNPDVLLQDEAKFEESLDQMAEAYEMLSTRTDEENGTCASQTKLVKSSTMSITLGGYSEQRKKMVMSIVKATQTSFLPEGEDKDPYAEKIAEISEKLEKFLPVEQRLASSGLNSRRRYHQSERSVTRLAPSIAQSEDLSTSDVFNYVLVNKISKKHSYLKPHKNSRTFQKRVAYRSPLWHKNHVATPIKTKENRPVTRYILPFDRYNKRGTIRFSQSDEYIEDKSWCNPIFNIFSPYI